MNRGSTLEPTKLEACLLINALTAPAPTPLDIQLPRVSSVRMYGEIKGRLIVKLPAERGEVLRCEVVDPERARARYEGKIVTVKASAIREHSTKGYASIEESDVLSVE